MNYKEIFASFKKNNILIIGDVMIDSYLWGDVDRISPEAPVPIVAVNKRENRMGGAANVALNIHSLGANPILCSVIGDDDKADIFMERMKLKNMDTSGIIRSENRITTTKFRVIGNNTQMLRVDEETVKDLNAEEEKLFLDVINNVLSTKNIDAIIFEDYDKGCLTQSIIEKLIEIANSKNIPMAADPKKKNFSFYNNIHLFKPNLKELKEGTAHYFDTKNIETITNAAQESLAKSKNKMMMVTLSSLGVLMLEKKDDSSIVSHHILAHQRDISDVSGAGDTVISVATLCMANKLNAYHIAAISNLAGGLVCEKPGVVTIDKEALLYEVEKTF